MKITFAEREIKDYLSSNKPSLYERDLGFPYDRLYPFDFEDLTYFTIKQYIENNKDWNGFDKIESLGGVKDKGRDCILKKKEIVSGIIQCKHSEKQYKLEKPYFVKELLKFLLYSIKEPSLIGNYNDFTYYIFSSSGFSSDTQELIESFNKLILKETKLESWVNSVISKHSSIKELLNYNNCRDKLEVLLSSVRVKKISINEFDLILSNTYNQNIVDAFFSIKKVIDIEKAEEIIEKHINPKISYKEAVKSLESASFDFRILTNYFGLNKETHIERKETNDLYNWLLSDLIDDKKNVAVLEGDAGLGKTIIIKDLYDKLVLNEFPVLAIKADKYYAENRIDLEKNIFQKENLSIMEVIDCLSNNHQKIVVLVDQLDALSQTLSSKREYIHTYNRLIDDLTKVPNVRVIISVRSFDLKFDSDLSIYNNSQCQKFLSKELTADEIKTVLGKFGIQNRSSKFINLLKIPSNLNLFCKLEDKSSLDYDSLKTVYDLQNAFWDELILQAHKLELKVKNLLYTISEKMYNAQQITIINSFKDSFQNELNFLKSKSVITENKKNIQFFHQTFYDFVFSKQFVETGKSIVSYIKREKQSINVRQPLKMVLEYLRDYNHKIYINSIRRIIKGRHFRFHIKSLTIISLSNIIEPSEKEKRVFENLIKVNTSYFETFFSSCNSVGWTLYLINNEVIYSELDKKENAYLKVLRYLKGKNINPKFLKIEDSLNANLVRKNAVFLFLRHNLNQSSDAISKFLLELPVNFLEKENLIPRLLISVENWNDNYLKLFEEYCPYVDTEKRRDNFWYFQHLKKISNLKPSFTLEKLKPALEEAFNPKTDDFDDLNYNLKEIIDNLFKQSPKLSFSFFYDFMKKTALKNKTIDFRDYYGDFIQSTFFRGNGSTYNLPNADDEIYNKLKNYLEVLAKKEKNEAIIFIKENINSNIISVLQLCAFTLKVRPSFFSDSTFDFLNIIDSKKGFIGFDDRLQFIIRCLIGETFSFFTLSQKERVVDIIFNIRRGKEYSVSKWDKEVFHRLEIQGKKQCLFIQQIPIYEINRIPRLKKKSQEFNRKFGVIKDVSPMDESSGGGITFGVARPVKESAYKFMSLENWEKSMVKYDDNYKAERHSRKGDKYQHSSAFSEEVKNNPDRFYSLLEKLINEERVSQDYMFKGFRGLVEAKYDSLLILKMYKKLIILRNVETSNLLNLIWSTEHLIFEKLIDNAILDFLCNLSLTHPSSDRVYNEGKPEYDVNQTVRSSSIKMVMWSSYNKSFSNQIFETVEKVIYDKYVAVKTSILINVHYIKILDKNRAFKIFKTLTDTNQIELLKNSFKAADYYKYEFFNEMLPYFNRIIENQELHKSGAIILSKAIIQNSNFEMSNELLIRLTRNSEVAICSVLNVAETNLFYENKFNEHCFDLIMRYLKIDGDDISSRYSGFILRAVNADNFKLLYPFLQEYVESSHIIKEPRYFYLLLISCAKLYPDMCLSLFEKTLHIDNDDIQKKGYTNEEPVKLTLAIYNSFNKRIEKDDNALKKCLDIFDSLLRNPRLREYANNAINSI